MMKSMYDSGGLCRIYICRCFNLALGTLTTFIVLDILHILYVVFYESEVIPGDVVAAFFLMAQVPISISFLRVGRKTSALLNEPHNLGTLPNGEVEKRIQFAQRVQMSGLAMISNIISLIIFAVCGSISIAWWLYTMSLLHHTLNLVSTTQIISVRQTKSKKDGASSSNHRRYFNSKLRQVKPL